MFKLLAAAFAAALLAIVGGYYAFAGGAAHPIKDAAATLESAKADEETHGDYVFVGAGIVESLDSWGGRYVVLKPPRNELEMIYGGEIDNAKTLHAIQEAVRKEGAIVKHVVCRVYADGPKVDITKGKPVTMVEDLGRATAHIASCKFIRTSVEAAFHRLTGYAEGDYAATVAVVKAERAANKIVDLVTDDSE